MIDILVYLFENYYDYSAHPKPEVLARKLSSIGFEDGEIQTALSLLSGLNNQHLFHFTCDRHSLRIYTAREQSKLDHDCLSFIAFLETAGVITPPLRELVIERGMILEDDPVPLSKFKIIVLMVLWSRDQELEPLIIEELLNENNPALLH